MNVVFEVISFCLKFAFALGILIFFVNVLVGRFTTEKSDDKNIVIKVLGEDKMTALDHIEAYISAEDIEKEYGENPVVEVKRASGRVLAIEFEGDVSVSNLDDFEDIVDVVCATAMPCDEVVIKVDSYGGAVTKYGLVAEHIERIKRTGAKVTACVDDAAASGGYFAAVAADKIIAAPFALIGSLGVVSEFPNFHKALEKYGVEYETITAGKYKRTIGSYSEITDEARAKHLESLESIHTQFKEFVSQRRPDVDIERIATGETWLAAQAKDLGMVDELMSYKDYLWQLCIDDHKVVLLLSIKEEEKFALGSDWFSCVGEFVKDKITARFMAR